MTSDQSRQTVLDMWAAFASRDPDRIRAAFTADALWLAPPGNATAAAVGVAKHELTPDDIVQFLCVDFARLFPQGAKTEFRKVLADGDSVMVETTFTAALPDGRAYVNDYCFVFEVADGRVRRMREYMDTRKGWAMIFGDPAAPASVVAASAPAG